MSELKQTMLGYIHHRLTSMQEVKDAILMWEMLMMKAVDDPGNHQSNTEKKKLAGLMRRLMAYRYEYLKDHRGVNMDETRWKELNGVPHKNMVDVQIRLFKECFANLQKSGFNETTLKSNKLDGILLLIQHMDESSTRSSTNYQFGQLLLTLCGKIPDSASTFLQPNETSTSDTSNDPSRSDVTTSGTSNRDASSGTSSDSSNENAMTQQQQQKYEEEMNKRTQKHEEEMNKLRTESAIKEQQRKQEENAMIQQQQQKHEEEMNKLRRESAIKEQQRNQEENAMIQQQQQREEALDKKGQELDTLQQQLQREKDLYDEKIAAMLLENQKKLKLARQKTKAANEKVKDMLQRLEDEDDEEDEEEDDDEEAAADIATFDTVEPLAFLFLDVFAACLYQ